MGSRRRRPNSSSSSTRPSSNAALPTPTPLPPKKSTSGRSSALGITAPGAANTSSPAPSKSFPTTTTSAKRGRPFFALYRYDQRAPGDVRTSLLWDGITWERERSPNVCSQPPSARPFSVRSQPTGQRIALGNGLISLKRSPGERAWRLFLVRFPVALSYRNRCDRREPLI